MRKGADDLLDLARRLVRQHGAAPLTAAVTAAGILVSQAFTAVAMRLWGVEAWTFALFLSSATPLIVLPPVTWALLGLVRRLHVAEEKLKRLAQIDPLTGVANRRHFAQLARAALLMAHRYKHPVALMIVDIDGLKRVNDQHGPLVGDQVLARVARLCERTLRHSDIFARFAGDEFVAALPHADATAAAATAERLRRLVEDTPIQVDGTTVTLTVTIGLAGTPEAHEASLQDLFALADDALNRAKVKGGNRVEATQWTPDAPRPKTTGGRIPAEGGCGLAAF